MFIQKHSLIAPMSKLKKFLKPIYSLTFGYKLIFIYNINQKIFIFKLIYFQITKSFLPNMMKHNHGHIVTVSSIAGFIGGYRTTGYSTTKYATVGYHKSLFTELNVCCY